MWFTFLMIGPSQTLADHSRSRIGICRREARRPLFFNNRSTLPLSAPARPGRFDRASAPFFILLRVPDLSQGGERHDQKECDGE